MSIGAITRLLNERGVPTRRQISRWERTTVWAILRNPAYKGTACFGKTETAPRQRLGARTHGNPTVASSGLASRWHATVRGTRGGRMVEPSPGR